MSNEDRTCEARIGAHLASRLDDLRILWRAQSTGNIDCPTCDGSGEVELAPTVAQLADPAFTPPDEPETVECEECNGTGTLDVEDGQVPDMGSLNEYGLCVDYVSRGTFKNQPEGFLRYQLSTGGPGDEFRFFLGADLEPYRVEYWFLDWFDGACRRLHGEDRALLLDIFNEWKECDSVRHWVEENDEPGEYADEDDDDGEE